jgi:LPPG:FO 2-phospho-L-lactate transferase
MAMRVVALAGGVGGAKLVDGLAAAMPAEDLAVIVNTGDDFDHLGLRICPDLDTVTYTLAGLANPQTGWGRADESWAFLETLGQLGGPTWFRVGDRDLALDVERTRRLSQGEPLSQVTQGICLSLGVTVRLLPMSDDPVPTLVDSSEGRLPFQDYFVRRACQPEVRGFEFSGAAQARPAPGALEAIDHAAAVVFCPSNPWVSLDPILSIPGIRPAIRRKPVLAVSPIVAGRALKGPAGKMFAELGIEPSALAVADHYQGLVGELIIDEQDARQVQAIEALGITAHVCQTVMKTRQDRKALAATVLAQLGRLVEGESVS